MGCANGGWGSVTEFLNWNIYSELYSYIIVFIYWCFCLMGCQRVYEILKVIDGVFREFAVRIWEKVFLLILSHCSFHVFLCNEGFSCSTTVFLCMCTWYVLFKYILYLGFMHLCKWSRRQVWMIFNCIGVRADHVLCFWNMVWLLLLQESHMII